MWNKATYLIFCNITLFDVGAETLETVGLYFSNIKESVSFTTCGITCLKHFLLFLFWI